MDQYSQPQQQIVPPTPPKNWLIEAILVTLFCCLPFGVVGIVFASQVNSKFSIGDYAGAQRASADAGRWVKISFWVGLGFIALWLVSVFLFGMTAFWFDRNGGNEDY